MWFAARRLYAFGEIMSTARRVGEGLLRDFSIKHVRRHAYAVSQPRACTFAAYQTVDLKKSWLECKQRQNSRIYSRKHTRFFLNPKLKATVGDACCGVTFLTSCRFEEQQKSILYYIPGRIVNGSVLGCAAYAIGNQISPAELIPVGCMPNDSHFS